ncbi:MAG: replicative DNA helicase [Prevotella sp.]|nr:replicative DNA helicase [Prevotella sp.]
MPNDNKNNSQRRQPSAKTPAFDPGLGHLPPQSLETERLVLGALMVDKDAFTVVSEILRPETFYEPRNQKVFAAIQTLSINEHPVDIITVTEQLKRDGTLEEVGGQMYVYDLTAHVASSAHVEYHSRILAQKYLARQLITFASQIETLAFDEGNDIELVMQEAEGKLFELSQKNMRQDYTQIDPVVKNALDIMQRAASNAGGLTGVASGYTKLDDMTSGWQKSDLVILAGRPAMGKTSFALSIAKNIAVDNRVPTAFFSLEMSNLQLVNRLISNTCEIDSKKVMNGQLDDAEWRRLDTNIRKLDGAPLYLDDTPGLSIFELRTKARRLVREKKVEIIMIDYLQLMNANGMRFGNRQEEVSTISRSLKSMAQELDIPIIALSQLNRSVEQRDNDGGKRPQLSDLRESGAIEQDADMVLFVHRPEYYHIYHDENGNDLRGMAQIIIAKHRKGAVGDVLLNFRGQYTRFDNPEDSYVPPTGGGEIRGSKLNNMPDDDPLGPSLPPQETPF